MIVISEIAKMQVKIGVEFYKKGKEFVLNETIEKFKAKDLTGLMSINMELDSIVAAQNELQNKRLMEIFNMAKGTGLLNEDELMRQIIQNQGVSPTKIVPEEAPSITTPPNPSQPSQPPLPISNEPTPNNAEIPTELREAVTPQLNLQQ